MLYLARIEHSLPDVIPLTPRFLPTNTPPTSSPSQAKAKCFFLCFFPHPTLFQMSPNSSRVSCSSGCPPYRFGSYFTCYFLSPSPHSSHPSHSSPKRARFCAQGWLAGSLRISLFPKEASGLDQFRPVQTKARFVCITWYYGIPRSCLDGPRSAHWTRTSHEALMVCPSTGRPIKSLMPTESALSSVQSLVSNVPACWGLRLAQWNLESFNVSGRFRVLWEGLSG